ncbi:DUF6894 family protein [Bradyrhizobium sp. UFLA05-153]
MPRYYFDIHNGHPYRDELGEDLPNDEAAWRTAIRLARDIEDKLAPGGVWKLVVRTREEAPVPNRDQVRMGAPSGSLVPIMMSWPESR